MKNTTDSFERFLKAVGAQQGQSLLVWHPVNWIWLTAFLIASLIVGAWEKLVEAIQVYSAISFTWKIKRK